MTYKELLVSLLILLLFVSAISSIGIVVGEWYFL